MQYPEREFKTEIKGEEAVDEGAAIIRGGGLVAFPTETVYGLGADAFNAEAVKSIFLAKGRPQDNPLIVHIPSAEWLPTVAKTVPQEAYELFNRFSPGPLTIVLPKADRLPLVTTAGLQTVGIRIPNSKIARELIARSGTPIAAPSANRSGRVSPTTAMDVYEDMAGRIPLILDGGDTDVGIESTVITLAGAVPTVLRPGAVTIEMLPEVLGTVVNHKGKVVVAEAPGMKYKHYAPKCRTMLFDADKAGDAVDEFRRRSDAGERVFVLCADALKNLFPADKVLNLGRSDEEMAANLYELLHEGENAADLIIAIEPEKKDGVMAGVINRLTKACAEE